MNWIMVVGVGLVVLLLVALVVPGRKKTSTAGSNESTTSEEMAETQRAVWLEAEEAVTEYINARGDAVGPARERMLRVADGVGPDSQRFEGVAMSERQRLMWLLAAEEIRGFVNDALARHPEEQQN